MHYPLASLACLLVGALIGAAQGYCVAYFRIPSFIVTLAGMLVFKGLALALLRASRSGRFRRPSRSCRSGFIPDLFPGAGTLHPTSLLIGACWRWLLVYASASRARAGVRTASRSSRLGFFVAKNAMLFAVVVFFAYLIASYRGLPNVLVIMTAADRAL